MDHDTKASKIYKYMKQLKDEDTCESALEKLERIDMTIELLSETKVGKAVNKLQGDNETGEIASRIINTWKSLAKQAGYESQKSKDRHRRSSSTEDSPESSRQSKHRDEREDRKSEKKKDRKRGSAPANDFEAMLTAATNVQAPKRKFPKFDISSNDLDTNYKPLPQLKIKPIVDTKPVPTGPPIPDDEHNFDPALFKYRSSERARVFAGRKKTVMRTSVDTLFNMCLRVIGNNIDSIEDVGPIPFDILKPVLEKCSIKQLAFIEEKNPSLEEDGDCLWENHFKKAYPNESTHDDETWKEAYFRIGREKEDRLKMLSQRMAYQKSETAGAGRKAILADAKAPREYRKRQIGHNTLHVSKALPHALEVSKARKQIFETGNKNSLQALPSSVRNLNSTLGASRGNQKSNVHKKGALMAKTMKMLNIKRR